MFRSLLRRWLITWSVLALASAAVVGGAAAQGDDAFDDEFDDAPGATEQPAASGLDDEFGDEQASEGDQAPRPEEGATAEDALADQDDGSSEQEAVVQSEPEDIKAQRFRAHNTFAGPTGGIHVVDAGSASKGSFRIQLATEFSIKNDFLVEGDSNSYIGGVLSLNWTALDYLELFVGITAFANSNDKEEPELFQTIGDTLLGAKGFYEPLPWLAVGGDFSLALLNEPGDIGVDFGATSFGFRGNASADLRHIKNPIPLITRFSLQYWFDNSGKLVEDTENARYGGLEMPRAIDDETRHLISPVERFALKINRVDMFNIGLGVEAPLRAAEDFYINPILEWTWGIPVNRQGYNCPFVASPEDPSSPAGPDSCLSNAGASSWPMNLTLGARILPPVPGLAVMVAADIGLTGTTDFVRELAPNLPYSILIGVGYAYDPGEHAGTKIVEKQVDVPVQRPEGRVRGTVIEAGTSTPIPGAVVSFPGHDLTPLSTTADGRFTTYRLSPGPVELAVSHPDYAPGRCSAVIPGGPPAAAPAAATTESAPPPGGAAATTSGESTNEFGAEEFSGADASDDEFGDDGFDAPPAAATPPASAAPSPASADAAPAPQVPAGAEVFVDVTCELTPLQKYGSAQGRVVAQGGDRGVSADVKITGPQAATVRAGEDGRFEAAELEPGTYTARVEADGYLIKLQQFDVAQRESIVVQIELTPRPKRPLVRVQKKRIMIRRQMNFAVDSDEILPSSDDLMTEIADVLIRNPKITLVEIQGHTDNRGKRAHNMDLSQRRAEAVRTWLTEHGVEATRMEARGFGPTKPLVPNITPRNRARNRRVQFIIKSRGN